MNYKNYTVIGADGANLRVLPSSLAQIAAHLKKGDTAKVITDFSSTNTAGGTTTKYICVELDGKHYWAVAKNFSDSQIAPRVHNYLSAVAKKAKEIYPLCIGKRHSGDNVAKVVSLDTLKKYSALSCNRMASIVMQEAGLLDKGVVVSHTAKRDGKKTIDDAVSNYKKLKNCKVVWVNKVYKSLPEEYKQAGCVYYQNSNACISVGNGHIFSCNKSKLYKYKSFLDYDRTSGYPFSSKILVVVVPNH